MSPTKKTKANPAPSGSSDVPSHRMTTRSLRAYGRKRSRTPRLDAIRRRGPPNKITDSLELEEVVAAANRTPTLLAIEVPAPKLPKCGDLNKESDWKEMKILVPWGPGSVESGAWAGSGASRGGSGAGDGGSAAPEVIEHGGSSPSGVAEVDVDPALARYLLETEGKAPPY